MNFQITFLGVMGDVAAYNAEVAERKPEYDLRTIRPWAKAVAQQDSGASPPTPSFPRS